MRNEGEVNRSDRSVGRDYILVSTDESSNPYRGDTSNDERRGLLCIKKNNLPKPRALPQPEITPGGALKNSWSGGYIFVIPNVLGTELTSKAVADRMCDIYAQTHYGVSGFRMAEFHDGDRTAGWAGWSFWGDASYAAQRGFEGFGDRLWVSINDQVANPWGNYGGESNGQIRTALTFVKVNHLKLDSEAFDSQPFIPVPCWERKI